MSDISFLSVNGTIQNITPNRNNCCLQTVSIRNTNGITNMILSPDTYVIGQIRLRPGMSVTAFYDGNAPAPLIFPPEFRASVIGRNHSGETFTVNFFDNTLTASDNSLRLNPSRFTDILTTNGQFFSCPIQNRSLLVFYSTTTKSLPPQTTPRKIIVLC